MYPNLKKICPFRWVSESRGLGWDYLRSNRRHIRNQNVDGDFVGIGIFRDRDSHHQIPTAIGMAVFESGSYVSSCPKETC